MITLTEILLIIIIHWVADFIMQDEKWALGKSKNWRDLVMHTLLYSTIWWFPALTFLLYFSPDIKSIDELMFKSLLFVFITFVAHTITDYFTSRIVSKKFENKHYGSSIPNFGAFTIIGIDQVLHYVQLFTTYYLLKS